MQVPDIYLMYGAVLWPGISIGWLVHWIVMRKVTFVYCSAPHAMKTLYFLSLRDQRVRFSTAFNPHMLLTIIPPLKILVNIFSSLSYTSYSYIGIDHGNS